MAAKSSWKWPEDGKGQVEILINLENKVDFIRSIFYKSWTKIPQAQTKVGWNWANLENKVDFLRRILYGSLTKCHKLGSGWPEIVGSENIPTVEKTKLWF